ncbi:hypothetical protein Q4566_08365 [Tamlana sp. 2_MG-2023]|uniref:hypothetical protein n=1 Tax=unclassified Tamlana TaxID=2614803 RepID=UPI0026E4014E|nr:MULTISPECIES: hypothetical protein [unclassified Tamlana]MDO6760206.1 hypothetical protein [Tamlana sp. 2_MG-2023]MDO6790096.1 hypothetical protein [Tamlana sp. 1_MG-2023]
MKLSRHNIQALSGGLVATLIVGAGAFILGSVSGYEAKQLLEGSLSGINTLCNTVVLASATILALLLTLLSVSSNTKSKLTDDHYRHILTIAKTDTIVLVTSMIIFQIFNIPIAEADSVPQSWFTIVYYLSLGLSAIVSGGLIVVVLMLYYTVASIIKIVGLGIDDHPFLYNDEDKGNSKNKHSEKADDS